jgi:hypothetical protein
MFSKHPVQGTTSKRGLWKMSTNNCFPSAGGETFNVLHDSTAMGALAMMAPDNRIDDPECVDTIGATQDEGGTRGRTITIGGSVGYLVS